MFVNRSIVIFEPGEAPRQDVKVSNSDLDDIYVQVEVLEVIDPGELEEQRIAVKDPSKLKLLATPNKLILPPSG